ncbi:MobA/MobL family protein [Pseudoflavonifractor phocaeensis]|uniref:MobA/MobL family protein n=1 Tax=Pseudoflavonifractor phocaeensis TaxID=1870988 RepID=UPI00210E3B7E|nr:MobA/MobL family protein [Pseudoflavonifractor phocaeensis]MCQ4863600.1 MobA/MobL family protein [Pseudoflavonifractor phocaeensis]
MQQRTQKTASKQDTTILPPLLHPAGLCFAIHDTGSGNPHAHIMLTMHPFTEEKTWGAKQKKDYILDPQGNKIYDPKKRQYKCKSIPATDWNEQTKAEEWRQGWAEICNQALEQNGHAERIDHRSYERQGLDIIPTIHLGAAASQMEKRGIRTERGNINREIEISNQKLRQLKARLVKLQNWLKDEAANTEPPTLADVIEHILMQRQQSGKATTHQLKAAAQCFNFLTANSITDMAGLDGKLQTMADKQFAIRDKLKSTERRQKTLDEHLRHGGNYKAYRGQKAQYEKLYAQYRAIKKAGGFGAERKAQKALDTANAYYDTHRTEIVLFEAAERYLKDVMQGRFDPKKLPPITKWTAERDKLNTGMRRLNGEYVSLKNETAEVEKIRRNVHDIMSGETRREQPKRAQDMEL